MHECALGCSGSCACHAEAERTRTYPDYFSLDSQLSGRANGAMKRKSPITSVLLVTAAMIALGLPVSGFGQIPRRTASPSKPQQDTAPKLPLPVAAAIVQQALAKYQTRTTSPKLDSAALTFKVTSAVSGGFGVSFWIITIGATATETDVQTVSFSYKLPEPAKPGNPSATPTTTAPESPPTLNPEIAREISEKFLANVDINTLAATDPNALAEKVAGPTRTKPPKVNKFQEELLKAIEGAAKAAKETPEIGSTKFQNFSVTIDYSVKFEGSGSASIPVFTALTIGPKGSINRETAHSLKLTFVPPKS